MRSTRSIRRKVKTWFFCLLLKHVETVAVYSYAEWLSDLHINFFGKKKIHVDTVMLQVKSQIGLHTHNACAKTKRHKSAYTSPGWTSQSEFCHCTCNDMPILADHTCNKIHVCQISRYKSITYMRSLSPPMRYSYEGFNRQTAPIQMRRLTMRRLTMSHLIRIHTVCPSQHTNPQHKRSERRIDGRLSI